MTGPHRVTDPDHGAIAPSALPPRTQVAERTANARRQALRQLMAHEGLTCTELARRAGFPSPNRLYNFLGGRSHSLSADTLAAIIAVLPHADVAVLIRPEGIAHAAHRAPAPGSLPDQDCHPAAIDGRTTSEDVRMVGPTDGTDRKSAGIQQCIQRLEDELALLKRLLAGTQPEYRLISE